MRYRESEPIEKAWIIPYTKEQSDRAMQTGEDTFRSPPEVKLGDGSVYQAWSRLAAGSKGGLWVGTWGVFPGTIWRLITMAEYNIPPPSNFTALQKLVRESLDA